MVNGQSAERNVTVTNPAGLHARPCAAIVQTVRKFNAKVQILCRGQSINAGNILEIMTLGAGQGTPLVLKAQGPDAEPVLDALVLELAKHYE